MLILCTNKGCLKSSNALFDEKMGEVICQECGRPIEGISQSMKRTLKSFGQVVRSKERKSFLVLCNNCKANRSLVLNQNGQTICNVCHHPITVPASFRIAIEESGTKLEVVETNTKDEKNAQSTKKVKRKKE